MCTVPVSTVTGCPLRSSASVLRSRPYNGQSWLLQVPRICRWPQGRTTAYRSLVAPLMQSSEYTCRELPANRVESSRRLRACSVPDTQKKSFRTAYNEMAHMSPSSESCRKGAKSQHGNASFQGADDGYGLKASMLPNHLLGCGCLTQRRHRLNPETGNTDRALLLATRLS